MVSNASGKASLSFCTFLEELVDNALHGLENAEGGFVVIKERRNIVDSVQQRQKVSHLDNFQKGSCFCVVEGVCEMFLRVFGVQAPFQVPRGGSHRAQQPYPSLSGFASVHFGSPP